jgi:hypothetical protein
MHVFGRSIAIVESPQCLLASLHRDLADVELSMQELSGSNACRAAVRSRRRPRLIAPGGRRIAALDRDAEGDDTTSDSW